MSIKQQATDHAVQHTTALAGSKVATGKTYCARPTPVAIDI